MVYTEQEARDRLWIVVGSMGGQRAFARHHHLNVSYVHDVLFGRRAISDRIARAIGLTRETTTTVVYREIEDDD